MLRRSDASPGPHPGFNGEPPASWHMDQAFLPQHYAASPRTKRRSPTPNPKVL